MKANYKIESATLADVDQLAALEQHLFMTDHRSRKNLKYLIQRTTVIVAKTEKAGGIVGYAILLGRKGSHKKRIYSLGVAASARNCGIGCKLVSTLETLAGIAGCMVLTLEVSDRNKRAIDFYQKYGFRQYGFRYEYYEDGGHALLMSKSLANTLVA